jgi:hypothetical protein
MAKGTAEDALAKFDYRKADDDAVKGLDALNSAAPTPGTMSLASDLAVIVGQAKLGKNEPVDAARWFALAHRLTPNRHLDPAQYLPEVVTAYDQAKPVLQTSGALEVHGSRGRVYIDGVDVGVPNATFEVSPGWHIVQIIGPERLPRGTRQDVPIARPSAPATSLDIGDSPTKEEEIRALKIRRARVAVARATDPIARAAGISGKLVAQAWRANAPGFDAPIFNKPVDAATAKPIDMLAWLAPPRALQPFDGRDKLPPPEPAWYEKRWVQASAVSTLIVVVLAGYLYSQRGGGMNDVNQTLGWRQ